MLEVLEDDSSQHPTMGLEPLTKQKTSKILPKSGVTAEIGSVASNGSLADLDSTSQKNPRRARSGKHLHEHTELGKVNCVMTCPNCLSYIKTKVRFVRTRVTHVAAFCLIPACLCLLPYFTPYFRNAEHTCPMCQVYLGTSFASGCNPSNRIKRESPDATSARLSVVLPRISNSSA